MDMDDKSLQQAVIDELNFDPSIDATHIGVTAENGVVTLTGHVESYAAKVAAERSVQRVRGVLAVAQEIEVRLPGDKKTSDDEIAARALKVMAWHAFLPEGTIQVKVQHGHVTLTGTVHGHYQTIAAEAAVRKLTGVAGVTNLIALRSVRPASATEVEHKIKAALERNADVEAERICVTVRNGDTVMLEGNVHTWTERWLAERAAWAVPGVHSVEDHLRVIDGGVGRSDQHRRRLGDRAHQV
jgi:osmotically-inducible protein OsmY